METKLENTPELPFSLSFVPQSYPKPNQLTLWVAHVP